MTLVFVLLAAVFILAALTVVIVPLIRPVKADPATQDNNRARLAVLADDMRELDAELAAGTLGRTEYDESRQELERQALEADAVAKRQADSARLTVWVPALVVAIAVPLLAVMLYLLTGQPAAINEGPNRAGGMADIVAEHANGTPDADLDAMIARLRQRLDSEGGDAQHWVLLARSYRAAEQPRNALAAYQKALDLDVDNADLLVEYANAFAVAHDHNLQGKPQQLLDRALQLAPDNRNALALAGMAALQRGDNKAALGHWQYLADLVPVDAPNRDRIDELIARAQGKAPAAAAKRAIHGTVTVSDELADQITAADTLFIFARAPDGPPMPLAVVRKPAPRFPLRFTLDDSQAMAPGLQLSQYTNVEIVARVSRTGSANLQPGDLEGQVSSVALGSNGVRIVIDHQVGS